MQWLISGQSPTEGEERQKVAVGGRYGGSDHAIQTE